MAFLGTDAQWRSSGGQFLLDNQRGMRQKE